MNITNHTDRLEDSFFAYRDILARTPMNLMPTPMIPFFCEMLNDLAEMLDNAIENEGVAA